MWAGRTWFSRSIFRFHCISTDSCDLRMTRIGLSNSCLIMTSMIGDTGPCKSQNEWMSYQSRTGILYQVKLLPVWPAALPLMQAIFIHLYWPIKIAFPDENIFIRWGSCKIVALEVTTEWEVFCSPSCNHSTCGENATAFTGLSCPWRV